MPSRRKEGDAATERSRRGRQRGNPGKQSLCAVEDAYILGGRYTEIGGGGGRGK